MSNSSTKIGAVKSYRGIAQDSNDTTTMGSAKSESAGNSNH